LSKTVFVFKFIDNVILILHNAGYYYYLCLQFLLFIITDMRF